MSAQRFKPYPAYKNSGVEWLGRIPTGWNITRLKTTITSCQNGLWGDDPNQLNDIICVRVADFDRTGFIVDLTNPTLRSIGATEASERTLGTGDLLLEKSGGGDNQPVGAVVQFNHNLPAICSNFVARITLVQHQDSRYHTYLHSVLYFVRINTRHIKQSTGIQNLDSSGYLSEVVAIPPESEQREIAAFLDRETARIDALVEKKERLIELLREQRSALITRAVTKGLNLSAPMKDSGVDWLGKVPAHWEVRPLKALSRLQTGVTLGKRYEGQFLTRLPYLRVANVQDGYLDLAEIAEVEVPLLEAARCKLQDGDVLMTEGGDFDKLGRGYVWEGQIAPCLHQNHIFAVRPGREIRSRYLALTVGSAYGRAYFTATSSQSTNLASTNRAKLGNFRVPAPTIEEQKAIVSFLDRETARIDDLIGKVQEAIERLKEYRIALISAAVTGKIDVREAL